MGNSVNILISARDAASAQLYGVGRAAESLTSSLLGLAGIAGAAGVGMMAANGLKELSGWAVGLTADFEQTEVAMTTILHSSKQAKQLLGEISQFAVKTPYQFKEVASTAKQLLAFGFGADEVMGHLKRLGDVASGVSAPIDQIAEAYGKAKAMGHVFARQLNQFTAAGIPIIRELAQHFGVAESSIHDMVEEGKVGFKDLEAAFVSMSGEGGQFFNMMETQSQTLAGLWSTLKDDTEVLARNVGMMLSPALKEVLHDLIAISDGFAGVKTEAQQANKLFFNTTGSDVRNKSISSVGMLKDEVGEYLDETQKLKAREKELEDRIKARAKLQQQQGAAGLMNPLNVIRQAANVRDIDELHQTRNSRALLEKEIQKKSTRIQLGKFKFVPGLNLGFDKAGAALSGGLSSIGQLPKQMVDGIGALKEKGAPGLHFFEDLAEKAKEIGKIFRDNQTPLEKYEAGLRKLEGLGNVLHPELVAREQERLKQEFIRATKEGGEHTGGFDSKDAPHLGFHAENTHFLAGRVVGNRITPQAKAANDTVKELRIANKSRLKQERILAKQLETAKRIEKKVQSTGIVAVK